MPETLPANPQDPYRVRLAQWHALYRASYTMSRPCAPAYTRAWGRLAAGLLQAAPPIYQPPPDEGTTLPITVDDLSDMLDEGAQLSAAYGVVFLRPVYVNATGDGEWTWSLLLPLHCEPVWSEGRLHSARVWGTSPDPRSPKARHKRLAIVEDWNTATGKVEVALYEAVSSEPDGAGVIRLGRPINPEAPPVGIDADHPYVRAATSPDNPERRLVPVVWEWDDGYPAPMFVGNEAAVTGLVELWDQEQDDALLTRKRVMVSEDLLAKGDVYGSSGQVLGRAGFGKRDNLVVLAAGMTAQSVSDGKLEVVDFGDDLVMRDRIERRESAVLESIGINPQSVGRSVTGRSDSAAAKRADQQLTMQTIAGPARRWEAALTAMVQQLATLNGQTVPDTLAVDVREGLKAQPAEHAETARALASAQAASRRTLIRVANPTWTAKEVDDEFALMQAEGRAAAPLEL
jgi:hypothetical protein